MSHAENKVEWCLKKSERELEQGNKHRGLIKINPDIKKAREHIEKSEHNLKTTLYLHKGGFTDWCSSTLFYTIYHCFLSVLSKFGFESRNQECTFTLINNLIEEGKIGYDKKDIDKINLLDVEEKHHSEKTAVNIREEYQYTTKLSLEDETFKEFLELAKRILDKTKTIIEE